MLNLNEVHRAKMRASGAFALDPDGEEVLRGLTVGESNFIHDVDIGQLNDGLAEVMLYNCLMVRHMAAKALYKASCP